MLNKVYAFFDDVNATSKETAYALLSVRVVTGVFFVVHGYDKFFGEMGLAGVAGFFSKIGIPMADMFALLVAFAELVGGIAILLGVMTRFWAFWLTIIVLVAWWLAKGFNIGDKGDLDLLALGLTLALLFAGPGSMSLSAYRNCKKEGMESAG